MRAVRTGMAAVLGLALLALALQLGAAAAGPTRPGPATVGWWWMPQQAPEQLPRPPYVAAGDLLVEGAATGPNAVAAVRVPLAQGALPRGLVLPVRSSRGTPDLVVCVVASGWAPAEVGTWTFRPSCGGPLFPMTASTDGTTVSAPATGLVRDGVLDVLVQPATDPTNGLTSTTSVTLAAPTTAALTTTPAPTAPAPTADPTPVPPSSSPSAGTAPLPAFQAGPPPVAFVAPPTPAAVPTPNAPEVAVPVPLAAPRPVKALDSSRTFALVVLVAIFALAAALTIVGAQSAEPSDSGTEVRGIGRFRTARTGPPAVRL